MRRMTACLSLLLVLCLALSVPALAAQDITDWINEYLQTDVAYIALYEPSDNLVPYGEILFNEITGRAELELSASEIHALQSVALADPPAPAAEDEPVVAAPEGYVLVSVRSEGREELLACMPETYAISPAEKRAAREAEEAAAQAALEAENAPEEPAATPVPTPAPTPLPAPEPAKKAFDPLAFLDGLDQRDLIYLIVILAVILVAIVELAFLLVYRRRAENVARNYLRAKSQLEKTKRELNAARSGRMQRDREIVELRDRLAELRGEKEKAPAEAPRETAESRESPDYGFKLPDYAEWKF